MNIQLKEFWLVEKDTFDEEAVDQLAVILKAKDISFARTTYIPFSGVDGIEKYIEREDFIIVPYGSIEFIKHFEDELDKAFHSEFNMSATAMYWADFDELDWSRYSGHFHKFLMNDDFVIVPYVVLKNNLESLFKSFGVPDGHGNMAMFIRPCSNDKIFTGKVIYSDNADEYLDYFGYSVKTEVPDHTLVVVSTPKKILNEWRAFILDREIVSISQYKTDGFNEEVNADDNEEVRDFLGEVVKYDYQPDEGYVCDVALVNGEYKMVEIGSPNCAGWYQMDVEKIVEAISNKIAKYNRYLKEECSI